MGVFIKVFIRRFFLIGFNGRERTQRTHRFFKGFSLRSLRSFAAIFLVGLVGAFGVFGGVGFGAEDDDVAGDGDGVAF
jgi:hypothetical protein